MDILNLLGSNLFADRYPCKSRTYDTRAAVNSFAGQLGAAAAMAGQTRTMTNNAPKIVYMKTDDMLYSGGNGTGLSFYLKYAQDSTEEDPIIVAKGTDESGKEFEQRIHVKDIDPRWATIVEMRALEAYTGVEKNYGFSSLPLSQSCLGLNERRNFIDAFQKDISDLTLLRQNSSADYYKYSMQTYLDFMKKDFLGI